MAEWRAANPEKRKAYYERAYENIMSAGHARRARIRGATSERVVASDVWRKTDGDCHICGVSVPLVVRYPHPLSASVDHIVPIAAGGAHTLANVALAHLVCNQRKGASVGVAA